MLFQRSPKITEGLSSAHPAGHLQNRDRVESFPEPKYPTAPSYEEAVDALHVLDILISNM